MGVNVELTSPTFNHTLFAPPCRPAIALRRGFSYAPGMSCKSASSAGEPATTAFSAVPQPPGSFEDRRVAYFGEHTVG